MNPVLYPINILLVIFHEGQLFYCRNLYSKELESKWKYIESIFIYKNDDFHVTNIDAGQIQKLLN